MGHVWGTAEWGAGGALPFLLPGSCPRAEEQGHGPCVPVVPGHSFTGFPLEISELVLLVGFQKQEALI